MPWHQLQDLNNPFWISVVCWGFVLSYYVVSALFLRAQSRNMTHGLWAKNGVVDKVTSVVWCLAAVLLLASVIDLTLRRSFPLRYLVQYFVLFIFLFAFIYNILEWHWPGMLMSAGTGWSLEARCVIVSVQAITTVGFTSARPGREVAEAVAGIETLVGIFFIAIAIAKAVATG